MKKYENIKELSLRMSEQVYAKRPDCQQIIEQKTDWALNQSELNSSVVNTFLQEFKENSNSFIGLMISTKLSHLKLSCLTLSDM